MFAAQPTPQGVTVRLDPVEHPRPCPARIRRPAPRGGRLVLGYWADDEFAIVAGELVNLSEDGILAIAEGLIRRDQRIWIRIDEATSVQTATATVLGANWLRDGRCALRLALDEDCPAGVYEALVACLARRGKAEVAGQVRPMRGPGLTSRYDGGMRTAK